MSNYWGTAYTALGNNSLNSNIDGSNNTSVGLGTLYSNNSGGYNTAIGREALYLNTMGNSNSAHGDRALFSCTTGSGNIALGGYSGYNVTSGSNNSFIGFLSNATSSSITNATAIGADAIVNSSNKIRLGNSSVTVIEGQVAWSNPSDRRLKENIIYTNRLGLDFIKKLQTVSYNYIADNTKTRYDGFIAQDIEKLMNDLGVPFSALKKSDDGTLSLAYSDFVMPLVNAVKEQHKIIESVENQLLNQKEEIIALRKIIEKLQDK